eukprot:gene31870-379_t
MAAGVKVQQQQQGEALGNAPYPRTSDAMPPVAPRSAEAAPTPALPLNGILMVKGDEQPEKGGA